MKTNYWLVLVTVLATTVGAQVITNPAPEISAPVTATTIAPTKAAAPVTRKKKSVTKKSTRPVARLSPEMPVTLMPGLATVTAENLNVRGQAGLKGEVVSHLKKGDTVTVISEINLDKPRPDEPSQWAKIALPSGTKVWVSSRFIDPANKQVAAKKLNMRGGPGENFSVLGVLEKGAAVTELASKGGWTQIETPAGAFAFVAARYLKQEATAALAMHVVEPVPPTTRTGVESQAITPTPTTIPPSPETPVPAPPVTSVTLTNTTPVVSAPAPVPIPVPVVPAAPEVADTNPPPPRIISHEGFVRPSISPVAPTYYELYDPATSTAINYLYSTAPNLDLSRYNGFHIVVTGKEGLDVRWQSTPILTIQKIQVLSTNRPQFKRVTSPRDSQNH